ncbi:unnamed protein product, partial [Linum tenue]
GYSINLGRYSHSRSKQKQQEFDQDSSHSIIQTSIEYNQFTNSVLGFIQSDLAYKSRV